MEETEGLYLGKKINGRGVVVTYLVIDDESSVRDTLRHIFAAIN